MSKDQAVSPLMHEFSTYIANAIKRKLPEEVVERAKLHLVDTFAAMISGSRLLPGKRATAYIGMFKGNRDAGVIGSRIITSVEHAALANGMCAHGDETDDTHPASKAHPGASVVPAMLAISEQGHLSGTAAIRAMALGYDVCSRTLLALAPKAGFKAHYYNGAFGQLFGAAATAGALLKLSPQKVQYLLSYAAQQASGLETRKRDLHHVEKAYAVAGMPAHNGVTAALMVKSGFSGVEDVYVGKPSFFSTYSPDSDPEILVRGLGVEYELMRSGIKRWSAGGPIQAPLHVLYELIQKHHIQPKDVASIVVRVPESELQSVDNRGMPNISLQHLLAVMLVDGTLSFKAAHDYRRLTDPKVLKARRLIEAQRDPSIPSKVRGWRCAMDVTLVDGRTLSLETMAAKGGYENPLTRAELEEKALGLVAPIMGDKRSKLLIAALYEVEKLKDMCSLRKLYQF